jgi:hypothetical protein
VPEVAGPLECNEVTARDAVHRLAAGGFDALADLLRPGRPASVTREDRAAAMDKPPVGFTRVRPCTVVAPSSWTTLPRTWPGSSNDAARN